MKFLKLFIYFSFLGFLNFSALDAQGYLHRTGKYLYDGSENEVILRGIGTGNWMLQEGYMMQSSGPANTQHEFRAKLISTIGVEKTDSFYSAWLDSHFRRIDVDSMKSWGFNSVRVAMHYKWLTLPVEDEPVAGENTWLEEGFVRLDSLLDWCADNEMYLILDLHGAPGGQGKDAAISDYDDTKPSLWESQANKDKTVALWRKLAERYSTEPWIGGYDLINETNWTFPENNNSKLKELMVNITNAIREVDTNHIVIIEGNSFANDYSGLVPPWDDNMIYSFHKYWSGIDAGSLNFATGIRNSYNVPIWLGESGENSNVWFTGLIKLCEDNHIGWSWWPVKKGGVSNVLNVKVNSDYTQLINYWKGTAANPGVDKAYEAVLNFANNHKLENCIFQKDVVDAMFRQVSSTETIPFKVYHTGEPVYAVDYNLGRLRYAYFDGDTVNTGGANTVWNSGWVYRNDGVDIEACTDKDSTNGYNVGWTSDGEWLEYTLDVDSSAAYTLEIRSASGVSGGAKIHFEVDGLTVSPLINLPSTGGWQSWKTAEVSGVILSEGLQKVKLVFDQGGANLNYFRFSKPVGLNESPFQGIYAETSADGNSVIMSVNKTITSAISNVSLSDFSISLDNNPLSIASVALQDGDSMKIVFNLSQTLYYGGIVKLSYSTSSVWSDSQPLEVISDLPVVNKLPVRYTIPRRIEAEDFSINKGMVAETCDDSGGGIDMGWANPGDYLDYYVYVPRTYYYSIYFRIASLYNGAQIIIRSGEGNTFKALDTLVVASTGGWQTWKTQTSTVLLDSGRYTLRLYVRNGEFNLNWISVLSAHGVGVQPEINKAMAIYPNPARDFIMIQLPGNYNGPKELIIYNSVGQVSKNISYIETGEIRIDTRDLTKGLYFIEARDRGKRIAMSKFVIQ